MNKRGENVCIRTSNKQLHSVDVMKFICALLVVAIHIPPFKTESSIINFVIVNCIARIAVPFFFVSSGYLLFRKTNQIDFDIKIPVKYALNIYRLYLIWTLIYFIPAFYYQISQSEKGIMYGLIIWLKDVIFVGSYTQLWYLNATGFAVILVALLLSKRIKLKHILIFAAILYSIGLLAQSYFIILSPIRGIPIIWNVLKIIEKFIITTRNGLFEGFIFISIGMAMAYRPQSMKQKSAIRGLMISLLFYFFECFIVNHLGWNRAHDMYIFLVPVTFYLFNLILSIDLKKKKVYVTLRKMSSLIFYLHMLVLIFIQWIFNEMDKIWGIKMNESTIIYSYVLIICCILSLAIIELSNNKKFRWLNKIY